MPEYRYTDSATYAHSLDFAYVETYSLLRGKPNSEFYNKTNREIQKLERALEKSSVNLPEQEARLAELEKYTEFTQYLFTQEGNLHPTAVKMARFYKEDTFSKELLQALDMPTEEKSDFMCAPIYRDALVFYDASDKITSVLNICLSCQYLETAPFSVINADFRVFRALAHLFLKAGHAIEKPSIRVLDEMMALYNKKQAK